MHEDSFILNPLGTRRFKSGGNRFSKTRPHHDRAPGRAIAINDGSPGEAACARAGRHARAGLPAAPPPSEAIASLASTTQKAPKIARPAVAVAFAILGHNSANATMTFCLPGTPRQVFGLITKWRLFESHSNSRKFFASPVPRGARLHFSHYNLPPPASRHRAGRPARP